MRTSITRVASLVVCLAASNVSAQVPTVPRHVGEARYFYEGNDPLNKGPNPITILTVHHKSGDWVRLHKYAVELLQTLEKDDKLGPLLGNVQKNYYNVVWQSTGPDGKDVITRVLVHVGLPPQHAARLPGLSSKFPAPLKTHLSQRSPRRRDCLIARAPNCSTCS